MTNTNQNRPAGGNASGRTTSAWRRAIAAAFPHTVPVLTGYLVLGAAYGVLMQSKGFGAPWVLLMSAVAFCGSMQFAAITLLTSAFDPLGAFIMSVMVNARHLFYGVSMLEKYRGLGGAKPILIYTLSGHHGRRVVVLNNNGRISSLLGLLQHLRCIHRPGHHRRACRPGCYPCPTILFFFCQNPRRGRFFPAFPRSFP